MKVSTRIALPLLTLVAVCLIVARPALALVDCNGNGLDDVRDIRDGTSKDCDENGVPDECQGAIAFGSTTLVPYPVGDYPTAVVTADFTLDGKPDLAVANGAFDGLGTVFLLINNNGRFTTVGELVSGLRPSSLAVGDFNGDGAPDLAAANFQSNTIAILLNSPETPGALVRKEELLVGQMPVSVTAGDVDGDGDVDLISANLVSNSVTILHNNGAGSFADPESVSVGRGPEYVTMSDVNHDGALDILVANTSSHTVSVLLNRDSGTFSQSVSYPTDGGPQFVEVEDFDKDGDLDLAVVNNAAGTIAIHRNDGSGTLTKAESYVVGGQPVALVAADLTENGSLDLVVVNLSANNISILQNDGDGTFTPASTISVGTEPTAATAGDWDGDGDVDLAVTVSDSDELAVLLNQGEGVFHHGSAYYSVAEFPARLVVGDFDGDEDLDVVTANFDQAGISLLLNRGTGSLERAPDQRFGVGDLQSRAAAAADLNNDGRLDIVVAPTRGDLVLLLRNNGGAQFTTGAVSGVGGDASAVATADLHGDGAQDVVVVNQISNTVSVLRNQGNWSFAPAQSFQAGGSPVAVTTADFDGDGLPDVAVANPGSDDTPSSVSVLLTTGEGRLSSPSSYPVPKFPVAITACDLDGDGNQDLATVNTRSSTLSVLRNDGNGLFAASEDTFLGPTTFPRWLTPIDVDNDGDLDLALTGESRLSVLVNSGGVIGPRLSFAVLEDSIQVASGDFDRDGDPDLVALHSDDDDKDEVSGVSVLMNLTPSVAQGAGGDMPPDCPPLITIASLTLDPPAVARGETAICTVTLENGAPPGGALVNFSHDGGFAIRAMPGNVPFAPGATSTTVPVSTERQADIARVTISAFHGNDRKTVMLTIGTSGGVLYRRGDLNADGVTDITDAVFLLNFLFLGGQKPGCEKSGDSDDDGVVNISDAVGILQFLFLGQLSLPEPFSACGVDLTEDNLTCQRFTPCP